MTGSSSLNVETKSQLQKLTFPHEITLELAAIRKATEWTQGRQHNCGMQIRIASPDDLAFIEGAYEHARAFMQTNGNATQWPEGYPGRIDAEEDIAHGHCFLVTDEAGPLAVFSFAPGPDETYAEIDGTWHSDADYHVIHCVAAVRGRGIARAIFTFAAEHADYLRCDTHMDNAPMRHTLESFGFRECGTITVANGTQRIAYDWMKEVPRDSISRP